jgi:hypothetical protein
VRGGAPPLRHVQAKQRHQLIVHALIEAANAEHVGAVELALDGEVHRPRPLDAEDVRVPGAAERRKGALRRQPRTRFARRQELLRAGRETALRDAGAYADVAERFDRHARARAEVAALVEVVIVRVAAAVFDLDAGRHRPPADAVQLADVAAAVGHRRERHGIAPLVFLRAVRHAEVIGVGAGTRHERAGNDPRRQLSFAHRRLHRPLAAAGLGAEGDVSDPAREADGVEQIAGTGHAGRQEIHFAGERQAGERRGKGRRRREHAADRRAVRHRRVVGDDDRVAAVLQDAAFDVSETPGGFAMRMIAGFAFGLGAGGLRASRQAEPGGHDRARFDRAGAGRRHRTFETAQLQAVDGRCGADTHELPRRRREPVHVRTQDVLADRQRVECESTGTVGHGRRHRHAEHRDHRARERTAAIVADAAGDAAVQGERGMPFDHRHDAQSLRARRRGGAERDGRARHHEPATAKHQHGASAAKRSTRRW